MENNFATGAEKKAAIRKVRPCQIPTGKALITISPHMHIHFCVTSIALLSFANSRDICEQYARAGTAIKALIESIRNYQIPVLLSKFGLLLAETHAFARRMSLSGAWQYLCAFRVLHVKLIFECLTNWRSSMNRHVYANMRRFLWAALVVNHTGVSDGNTKEVSAAFFRQKGFSPHPVIPPEAANSAARAPVETAARCASSKS